MRVMRAYPAQWSVFALGLDGVRDKIEVIGSTPARPTYAEVEAFLLPLAKRSIANADIGTRLRSELAFNQDSLKDF